MGLETVIYITNIIICAIIALLMTDHWVSTGRTQGMRFWMYAAWVMLVADVLFALRPSLPFWMDRIAPTLLVTIGQTALFVGARVNASKVTPRNVGLVVIGFHAVALTLFFFHDPTSPWRRIINGVTWATLSFVSYYWLRRSPAPFWKSVFAPAKIFMAHGLFHLLRIAMAIQHGLSPQAESSTFLEIVGDLEVSFFMVALFVGLLMANLQKRNEELSNALAEVQTLSGLLPICAWCKKVRDDGGYWRQVDDYFRSKSQIRFSHGVCTDCAEKTREEARNLDLNDL